MKKTLCILLALLMVFSFAACGNSGKDQGNKPSEADEVKLTRGTWNEAQTEFVNESTGIKITLPSGYAVMGDKELVENYAAGSNIDFSTWTEESYKTEINIPDTAFVNYLTGANCAILYENLKAEKASYLKEDQYLDIATDGVKKEFAGLEGSDYYDITLSGQNYRAIDMNYSTQGMNVSQTMAVRKVGDDYITVMVFTAINDNTEIQEMEGFFN